MSLFGKRIYVKIADKVKLLVIPLILIPFFIIVCGVFLFGRIYIKNLYGSKQEEALHSMANPILAMNGAGEQGIRDLNADIAQAPDLLRDVKYLNQVSERLMKQDCFP